MLAPGQVGGAVNSASYSQHGNGSCSPVPQIDAFGSARSPRVPGQGKGIRVCVMACRVPALPP